MFSLYENTKVLYVKHGDYKELNITKKGRSVATQLSDLKRKYREALKISKKKIDSAQSLMPYIPPVLRTFCNNKRCDDRETENEDNENQGQVEII